MSIIEENITQRPLEEVLPEAFLGYSKYVILHRAIPDVRDGLKPVHRRIIYSMDELGMYPDKPHSKSARLVGHAMGAYHPHGDSAIYEATVRMAQPWAARYPFVDGHGNFGSVDGDPAAAMRYTEIRMTQLAKLMCADLEKNTVPFRPNYDNRLKEPVVLPSPIPNILVNGTGGIAVGLATNMPPHNLYEVVEALIMQIDKPDITVEELMNKVPGPDFPTGGFIVGTAGIKDAYTTGRGKIIMRGKASIVPGKNGKSLIVITEIPYQVNKSNLAAKIEAISEDKLDGISDVRDESDREGMRLVVECRKEADPYAILNHLYKYTQLQESFGIINLVVDSDGIPKVLNLKELNQAYISHRKQVVIKRTQYDLDKAKARAHVLEGLVIAINNLDEVIALIRSAKNPSQAKAGLIMRFELSDVQAQAVLDLKLQHLTNLELDGIKKEYEGILKLITALEEILADVSKVYDIVKKELREAADKFGDQRKTVIIDQDNVQLVDTTAYEEPEKEIEIVRTRQNFIKQVPSGRPGKGRGSSLAYSFKDGDYVEERIPCTDKDTLYFFTNAGHVYTAAAKLVPESSLKEKGRGITNLLALPENEKIVSTVPLRDNVAGLYFLFVTKEGQVMRTPVADFAHSRSPEAIGLRDGDELCRVLLSDGSRELFVATISGQCIRYPESDINPMGRKSKGVKGITLTAGDAVLDAQLILEPEPSLISVTERGFVKKTSLGEYKPQGRGGKGVAIAKVDPDKTGFLAGFTLAGQEESIVVIQQGASVSNLDVKKLKEENRAKTGLALISVMLNDYVTKIILER